jgi:hypothetical protein
MRLRTCFQATRYGQAPQDGRSSGLPAVDAVMDQVDIAIAGAIRSAR